MEHLSHKPFGEALRTLMSERELTYRGLAEVTRELDGKGMTTPTSTCSPTGTTSLRCARWS